uniref:Interleukin 18 n=2 Tax=Latimeria TaxID=7896 RepID=M3XGS4_LATCH|nr:PREDICTED: interleukin-18 isoform X2 [Latimeria chalumnae]AHG59335.1 IL-18 [Latimeria menadoensis]|eukprot:XP_005987298.1 PREDICTED: interleukin-18 isoform X2 [Latimeria chalumnae]
MSSETSTDSQATETEMWLAFFNDDGLWFEEVSTDYESDAWKKYTSADVKIINACNQILVAQLQREDELGLVFHDVPSRNIRRDGMEFTFQYYKETKPKRGIPLVFLVKMENKTFYMYCDKESSHTVLRFKEGNAPADISDNENSLIFYQVAASTGSHKTMFKAAYEEGLYLAFEKQDNLNKLVLKRVNDEVDETATFRCQ